METRLRHLAGYLILSVIIVIAANTIVTIQNLSVILQRAYYKAGKRKGVKQRLFKRTPIHDHFRTSMSLIEPGCTVKFTKPDQLFHESKITDRFSTRNTPQRIGISNSLWMMMANTAIIPPIVRLPVSPINTCAG